MKYFKILEIILGLPKVSGSLPDPESTYFLGLAIDLVDTHNFLCFGIVKVLVYTRDRLKTDNFLRKICGFLRKICGGIRKFCGGDLNTSIL
jgi:hypothetical protein